MTKLAYIGRAVDQRTKSTTYGLAYVVDAGNGEFKIDHTKSPMGFMPKKKKVFDGASPGSVYEIETEDKDGSTYITYPPFWHDARVGELTEGDRVKYQAADKIAHSAITALKQDPHNDLMKAVRKLQTARGAMNSIQAAAFDAWLLNAIRRY